MNFVLVWMQLNMQIERNVVSGCRCIIILWYWHFRVCLRLRVFDIPITLFQCILTHQNTHTHRIVSVGNVAMRNEKTNVPVNNFHLTLRLKLTHRIRAPIVQTYTYNHISDMESALHFVPIDSTFVWPVSLCISVERFTFYIQYGDDKLGEAECICCAQWRCCMFTLNKLSL